MQVIFGREFIDIKLGSGEQVPPAIKFQFYEDTIRAENNSLPYLS